MLDEITVLDVTMMALYYSDNKVLASAEFVLLACTLAEYYYSKETGIRNKVAFVKKLRSLYKVMHPDSDVMLGLKASKDLVERLANGTNRYHLRCNAETRLSI